MIELRDQYDARWATLLAEAASAGCFREGLDLKLARLLGFGAVNWVAQWYAPGGERDIQQIAEFCWEVICFGVIDETARPQHPGAGLVRRARQAPRRAGDQPWKSPGPSTT
jgi:hypothetical protein